MNIMHQMCQHGLMMQRSEWLGIGRDQIGIGEVVRSICRPPTFIIPRIPMGTVTCGQDIGHVLLLALQWRVRWMARYFVGCEF